MEIMGGEEMVFDLLLSGESMSEVARRIDVSRGLLYQWMHLDEERWERYQEARRLGAYSMADEALEILDGSNAESIQVDRERAKFRQWMAERANRRDFGKEAKTQVNVSLGSLHLLAMKDTSREIAEMWDDVPEAEFEEIPQLESGDNVEDLL